MKPAAFGYIRPASVGEAVSALASLGDDAKVLAGGQSLVPLMNFRLSRPAVLVDLGGVAALAGATVADDAIRVGAMTRQRVLERMPEVAARCPVLPAALRWVGHVQIRNRGTVGGSLAHADPAAELPAVAALLEASFVAASVRGERRIAAGDFFVGPFGTALAPDELLTEVVFPTAGLGRTAFLEIARRHGDFALAGVAGAVVEGAVRLVGFGVGWTPVRLAAAERAVAAGARADAPRAARDEVEPMDDIHADAAYRRELVEVLTERVLGTLLA